MKKSCISFTVFLLLFFILNINIVLAEEALSQSMLDELVSIKCNNSEYLNCLGISESRCIDLTIEAFNSCPLKYMESFDEEILDPVCNTNKFVDLSGISPELFSACGKHLKNKKEEEQRGIGSEE